jgi:hypothetical protein
VGAEFHVPRRFDDYVDPLGAARQKGVIGGGAPPSANRLLELGDGLDGAELFDARIAERRQGRGKCAVRDGRQAHAWDISFDLKGDAAPHVSGSDQGDPYRPTLGLTFLERFIHNDHDVSCPSNK